MLKRPTVFFNILIPVFIGILMLYYYQGRIRKASEIGLGEGTSSYTPYIGNYPIHIMDPSLTDSMKKGWLSRGSKDVYLWLGNSQLHGVNQHKEGQVNCVAFLFDHLKLVNKEILGVSYPNANLQEFLVSVLYFAQEFPLQRIILPVFYDDMREDGIRDEININSVVTKIGNQNEYYDNINNIKQLKIRATGIADQKNDNFKGIQQTAQEKSERYLDAQLEKNWKIWESRPDIRGNIFVDIYKLRNSLLGIKANTVRKMIPGRFADNYNSLLNIIKFCKDKSIQLIVYIPPLRNDVLPPYNLNEYNDFIQKVKKDCVAPNVTFLNLGNLVPDKFWGVKQGTSFGKETEIDFMHFQETGHKLIADTIFKTISQQLGSK
jgi:hypothetical protein